MAAVVLGEHDTARVWYSVQVWLLALVLLRRYSRSAASQLQLKIAVRGSRMVLLHGLFYVTTDDRSDGADASLEAAATADLGW